MTSIPADQHKSECIAKMGAKLGTLFAELWQDVAFLHGKWQEFVELYGINKNRIELLNDAAPTFFGHLQDILWEDMLIGLSRLVDPEKSAGRTNLTLQALPDLVDDQSLKDAIVPMIHEAMKLTEFTRDWRNRRIAHRDLELAISDHAQPLKSGSRQDVRAALTSIDSVLNKIQAHYLDSETKFDAPIFYAGAVLLLRVLHDGVREGQEREERHARGEFLERDMPPQL